ncbi:MAG TPA: Stp1/IreP family PP2C-type Ser/Thr phosphatase [Terriglobales bacterium]|jgi:PPM family protein phosphatase|nr:Stp1/IreP family PP2C-type Ser/Thr phosphatase [Terriglobales bacterium]
MPTGQAQIRAREGIEVAGASDVGCQRENNEDSLLYWEPSDEADFQRKGRLAIVADGMGGHEGGQEASRIATETIQHTYAADSTPDPQSRLVKGFQQAHDKVIQYATQHLQLRGMGTTATALAIVGNQLYFAHIGDSRLYLIRGQEILRLTRDHSYVGRLFENGVISAEEAEVHPQRHILTAALGTGPEIPPDTPERPILLQPTDALMLCSDGLWGVVADPDIRQIVTRNTVADACQRLIDTAKQRGGPDNITVMVLRLV